MISEELINSTLKGSTTYGTCKLDSHADTCCLGQNFNILNESSCVYDVLPYNNKYSDVTNINILSEASVYTHPVTHTTYTLIIHDALFFGNYLKYSLINPNQLRNFGLQAQDNPYNEELPISVLLFSN